MNPDSITRRLLTGSSYPFAKAVRDRLASTTVDQAATVEQHALDAAAAIVTHVINHPDDWHVHRGIEAIHHADWLWRRAQRLTQGPEMKITNNAEPAAESPHTVGQEQGPDA